MTTTRARVLAAIAELTTELGYAPSLRQIGARVGRSPSTTAYHVGLLTDTGRIARRPGTPRSITIIEESQAMSDTSKSVRAAAALIRAVANRATNGGWSHEHEGGHIVHGPDGTIAEADYAPDAAHIALWDPDIARATAEVLDDIAQDMEDNRGAPGYGWGSAAGLAALILPDVAA